MLTIFTIKKQNDKIQQDRWKFGKVMHMFTTLIVMMVSQIYTYVNKAFLKSNICSFVLCPIPLLFIFSQIIFLELKRAVWITVLFHFLSRHPREEIEILGSPIFGT